MMKRARSAKLVLSNPEKIMYSATGFRKTDVVDYYRNIAPVILPHLRRRPLTMKRFPEGAGGESFYEKNAPAFTPDWVNTFPVGRSKGGAATNYITVDNRDTLLWLANLASLELHVLLSRAPQIQTPTFMVFDLDPGAPANIADCGKVALKLRALFEHLGLDCFVKVSGSKGLQLYVPLNTPVTYIETGAFAHAVAELLAHQEPEFVVAKMAKKVRAGRIFIDWSQNDDSKTTVAVYSLRAKRDRPFVSMPLQWKEVEKLVKTRNADAVYFEAGEALKRVDKLGDLFEPVLRLKQKLPALGDDVKSTPSEKRIAPSSLKKYREKRSFGKTAEPRGRKHASSNSSPLFVIQKHQASHLHYDFRLEMEGVLKSWAVPKGPPLELGEKRLAMQVEDHPFDYAHFEGTIPAGNYGAGTVMVWDTGTYSITNGEGPAMLAKGHLDFLLEGSKLKGAWSLIRLKKDDKSWLLIKRENAQKIAKAKADRSALSNRTLQQIT